MTEQPAAQGSPDPNPSAPAPTPPGWSAPPNEPTEAGAAAPPPQAKPASKWRVAIPLVLIGGFLAFVLWAVRDNQSADDLTAGTCFDIPTSTEVSTVTKHACTEPHDAEVIHNAEYTDSGTTYPISLTFDGYVDDTCVPVFQTYVGDAYDDREDLTIGYFFPTREGWSSGDRTITCYVYNADNSKLTQSVRSAAGG